MPIICLTYSRAQLYYTVRHILQYKRWYDQSTLTAWLQQICAPVKRNMIYITVDSKFEYQAFSCCFSSSAVLLCTQRLCACKLLDWLKLLLHSEHSYGFSPVWTLMWTFSFEDSLNALSHKWHLCGFSPLWILLCLTWSLDFVNRFLQKVHSNLTFSSSFKWLFAFLCTKHLCCCELVLLCTRLCCCKCLDRVKRLSQPEQLNGFSPVWILMCVLNCPDTLNALSHMKHLYGFSPLW